MLDNFAAFDGIALALLLLSAVMGFSRGFLRELATLGAFTAALTAAYFARRTFRDDVILYLPEGTQPIWADVILIGVSFLIVYIAVAWLGRYLSKAIQGMEGISIFDRIAGVAFGLLRAGLVMLFFVVLIGIALTEDRVPRWIHTSATYEATKPIADRVRGEASEIGKDAADALPKADDSGQ